MGFDVHHDGAVELFEKVDKNQFNKKKAYFFVFSKSYWCYTSCPFVSKVQVMFLINSFLES